MLPKVFVVQQTMRLDRARGELVPKFDVEPAREYGELEFLLSPSAAPFRPDALLPELHEKLRTITDRDYLLLSGNPVLIGMACAIAADYTQGFLNLLQWNGREQRYLPIEVQGLFNDLAMV